MKTLTLAGALVLTAGPVLVPPNAVLLCVSAVAPDNVPEIYCASPVDYVMKNGTIEINGQQREVYAIFLDAEQSDRVAVEAKKKEI